MEWSWFNTPLGLAIIAPSAALVGALLGVTITSWTTRTTHRERLTADRELAALKFDFDKDLADRRFRYDRDLNDHKRRVELAEIILADFYQIISVFHEIRNPGAMSSEWEDRLQEQDETSEQSQNRNVYFVPLARIRRNSEFISGMMSRRYRSKAVLGDDIDGAFQAVHENLVRVQVSAGTLMRMVNRHGQMPERNFDLQSRCEADIWMGYGEPDHIAEQLALAVSSVEGVCRRIITAGDARYVELA